MKADLHIHTTYSDGVYSPAQLAQMAAEANLDLMALTDHDSFEGFENLKASGMPPLPVLQGVELSLNDRRSLHLLCYGLPEETEFHRTIRQLADHRLHRADDILDRCEAAGVPLDRERVMILAKGSVGRPHIAQAMVEAGYVSNICEAFSRWLNEGRPCYVGSERLNIRQAISLARQNGFVPVLAHPWETADNENDIRTLVRAWADLGLMGIEVYHPSAAKHGYGFLHRLADDCGLLVTGGSDFHRPNDRHGTLGQLSGEWHTCTEDIARLKETLIRCAETEKGGGT